MNNLTSTKRVVIIGELNVDLIASGLTSPPTFGQEILATDFQTTLGSASAIFACGVAKLGHHVAFVSKVGLDDFGKFCLDALHTAGVSTAQVMQDASSRTGVTISLSSPQDRALVTFLGAISELKAEHLPLAALFAENSHLHMTSYFLQDGLRPSFPKIMSEAQSQGLTTSFDPNADPTSEWGESIREVLNQTDVLFLNELEAKQLTRHDDINDALKFLGRTLPCAVIKLGPRGAIAMRGEEIVFAPGFSLAAVDTTGAGDSFAAGFLHGFLNNRDLQTCLTFGNACGALSTLAAGGTTNQPTQEQLRDFLQNRQ